MQGSRSPSEHGLYVWKNFVLNSKAKQIAIVAHSAGGSVTASMISKFTDDFKKRVNAIAFTDSFGSPSGKSAQDHFEEVCSILVSFWFTCPVWLDHIA